MMGNIDSSYVRPPAVAGTFYPGSPAELAKMMAGFFHQSPKPQITSKPLAVIAPHAGFVYSGQIAAQGYKVLEGQEYKTVIVISPSHMENFRAVSGFDGKAYSTPLGEIPIDKALTRRIAEESDTIRLSAEGHVRGKGRSEHALEVQLPFLQMTLGKFDLVALVMGDQEPRTCAELGGALARAIGERDDVLIVASSDLSHFHDSRVASRLDGVALRDIEKLDFHALASDLETRRTEACGGGPIIATMIAARELGADTAEITGIGNSGDATGDRSNVVGYLSAIIYRGGHADVYEIRDENVEYDSPSGLRPNDETTNEIDPGASDNSLFGLSESDKNELLSIARESIGAYLKGQELLRPACRSEVLNQPLGAFVTLHLRSELRGCIGTFRPGGPLHEVVAQMARQAAFSDYRFRPVTNRELAGIDIEISVLTPMRKLERPEEIVVGRDGLSIQRGKDAGVLLPQVPVEQGWDREAFLDHACLKAGLPTGSWKDRDTRLYVFQADIFGEKPRKTSTSTEG